MRAEAQQALEDLSLQPIVGLWQQKEVDANGGSLRWFPEKPSKNNLFTKSRQFTQFSAKERQIVHDAHLKTRIHFFTMVTISSTISSCYLSQKEVSE